MSEAIRHSQGPSLPRSLLLPRPPSSGAAGQGPALVAKGFRPFFLLAAAFAVAIVPLWLLVLHGNVQPTAYLDPTSWHAHEMIFGFAVAVIAGFLLTAVGNWTQRETATGASLLGLAALWLLGRLAMTFAASLPAGLVAAVDLAFLPALGITLGRPLIATKNRRNFVMLALLSALWVANLVMHLQALGSVPAGSARGASLVGVDLVVLVITIMAGRIFPMFTRNATGLASIRNVPSLDKASVAAMTAVTALDVLMPASREGALLAGCAGILALLRAWHWGAHRSLKQPLLWVLHAGYAWLALGLALRGLFGLQGAGFDPLSVHALTVGAIGSLTLGMMARVSLGHTGRMLVASPAVTGAFIAINMAAAVRVFGPMIAPRFYFGQLVATGLFWVIAFTTFLVVYARVLSTPRVDGRPG